MKLSQIVTNIKRIEVINDQSFESIGLLGHQERNMLVTLYDKKYLESLKTNGYISCVITYPDLVEEIPKNLGIAVTDHPQDAFYEIHEYLAHNTNFYGENFDSHISSETIIAGDCYIAKQNVHIGKGTVIEPKAVILENSLIGENVIIRSGAVIGGEGFEPKLVNGKKIIVPHTGGVKINDRVEVQSNSHIAKSVFGGFTEIGEDTKIDALVHIAHNVKIGKNCEIAAGAIIAGSTTIGDNVWIGPNATISSEILIEDNAFVALGSAVFKDVKQNSVVLGVPARFLRWRNES